MKSVYHELEDVYEENKGEDVRREPLPARTYSFYSRICGAYTFFKLGIYYLFHPKRIERATHRVLQMRLLADQMREAGYDPSDPFEIDEYFRGTEP